MAIITCPECGQQLSGEEEYCPNCNRSVPRNIDSAKSKKEEYVAAGKLLQRVAVALLAVGAIGGICAAILHNISLDEYHKNIMVSMVLGIAVFASSVFPSAVCYGLGTLVSAKGEL